MCPRPCEWPARSRPGGRQCRLLHQSRARWRLPGPFRDPRRQRLLGHGDDVAVGADLPAPPFDGPRGRGAALVPSSRRHPPGPPAATGRRRSPRTAAASLSTTPPAREADRSASRSPTRPGPRGPTRTAGRWCARRRARSTPCQSATRTVGATWCGRRTATAASSRPRSGRSHCRTTA